MPDIQLRRWTREEYDRMIDAGVLQPEDHVELIEGEIVATTPQKSPHTTAIGLLGEALRRAFGSRCHVRLQAPLALTALSEPEPDVAVVSGSIRDYRDAHPSSALLVVEVADSTPIKDLKRKGSLYAMAGIADYWILNLGDRRLEVCPSRPWRRPLPPFVLPICSPRIEPRRAPRTRRKRQARS